MVQQQAQLTQMVLNDRLLVQLLLNDRLRPRSSSTSKQQRNRCGCTRSAAGVRWCLVACHERMLCSNRGPQT